MYSVNFTCEKARSNRANLNKIKLWVNVDGVRSSVNLDLRVNPEEFKKSLFSKKSTHINRYCSAIRLKIDEYYAECVAKGLQVQASTLTDFVRNGYEERLYMLYELLDDYLMLAEQRIGGEIGQSTYRKYLSAVEQLKAVIPNKPLKAVDNADILSFKYHLTTKLKLKTSSLLI